MKDLANEKTETSKTNSENAQPALNVSSLHREGRLVCPCAQAVLYTVVSFHSLALRDVIKQFSAVATAPSHVEKPPAAVLPEAGALALDRR